MWRKAGMKLKIDWAKKEWAYSLFVVLYMFRINFLTLNSIMFGKGLIYQGLKYLMYLGLVILFLISCRQAFRVIHRDVLILYALVGLMMLFTCVIDNATIKVIEEEKLVQGIFISGLSGFWLYRCVDNYDFLYETFKKISYLIILYATVIVLTSQIGTAYMGFSYAILAFILFALYDGSFGGNKVSLLFGSIGTVVNILGGTRGSILCIVAFLLFYLFFSKQYRIILLGIILATIFFMCYDKILASFTELANILGIESRIIDALSGLNMSGISYTNGRTSITNASLELIRNNPLGYGFLGERAKLNDAIYWFTTNGYAHNIFLEIILQFGIIFGAIIVLFVIYKIIYFLIRFDYKKKNMAIAMVFLCYCVNLFVSRSYTTTFEFWAFWGILKGIRKE